MGQNLRVLFLDTRPIRRGAQVFVHELKSRFKEEGIAVKRVFLYKELNYENLSLNETDIVLPFKDNNIFEIFPTVHPRIIILLAKEIKVFSPDIILCNGSRTLKYAAAIKRFYPSIKSRWIYRVIDSAVYWNRKSLTQLYYKYWVIPAMDAAVGVSQRSLDDMIQHYSFKKPSICIPRAINIDYFANYLPKTDARDEVGIPENAFVLLFLGNFTSQKRPDRFIDIINSVKESIPFIHGLMVGDGPLMSAVSNQISSLNLEKNITCVGYKKDVRPWIAMSDLLLLTSDTEGMPGVVLEAAAMKKITISSDVGGVKEFINHKENGYIISCNYLLEFVKYIIYVKNNDEINLNMTIICFENVLEKYSFVKIKKLYLDFLNRI
ncbi:MAG: glycosyltransferase family 4 protein [Chitinophagaceae bacterium]|nr:glycosyltransferase family 4 protein [Chitinophagaceae bacterium]